MRVLLVEDDPRMRQALARGLEIKGCLVDAAWSVSGAIRALDEEKPFDLLVIDVCLGERSGVEIAEYAWRLSPAPAIIAVSGEASREAAFRLGQLGVRALLDKADLLSRFDELLELAAHPSPLGPHVKAQVGHATVKETVERVREGMFEQALASTGGSAARASVKLGVSRQAVYQMLERRKKRS